MEIKKIDDLTADSVSVATEKYVIIDGTEYKLGLNRCAYVNSTFGRAQLAQKEPAQVVNAVMAMWGDSPTIIEEVVNENQE